MIPASRSRLARRFPGPAWVALLVVVLLAPPVLAAERVYVLLPEEGGAGKVPTLATERGLRLEPVLPPGAGTAAKAAPGPALRRLARWHRLVALVDEDAAPGTAAAGAEALLRAGRVLAWEPAYEHALCQVETARSVLVSPPLRPAEILALEEAHALVRSGPAGIVVAVVDGGTDWRHEDLVGVSHGNPGEVEGNGLDDDGNGWVDDARGWNFPTGGPDPTGLAATPMSAEHGTHIAGIVCGDDTNDFGVVGVSGGARLLSVNAADPEVDRIISYGYEGILYAALSGVDVINASWGRTGRWSAFEADLLEAVEELGSVVVAAAGNQLTDREFFPASYPTVLSVTSIRAELIHDYAANAAAWIDVSAPGSRIWSTMPGDGYDSRRGTSQAAAHASGVAALVRAQRPELGPRQVREQIRWTALSLRDYNEPALDRRMGCGVVHALRALQRRPAGLFLSRHWTTDQDGDGYPEGGELLDLGVRVENALAETSSWSLRLFTGDPHLQVLQPGQFLGPLAHGAAASLPRAFKTWIHDSAPIGHRAGLTVQITTPQDTVHTAFEVELRPVDAPLAGAGIVTSLTCSGKLGFAQLTRAGDPGGEGLRRPDGPTRILGGGLVLGTGEGRVSDAIQAAYPAGLFEDFVPHGDPPLLVEPDGVSPARVVAGYIDNAAADPLGVVVRQEGRAFTDAQRAGVLLSSWVVQATREDLVGLRLGLLVDWALQDVAGEGERVRFDPEARLAWAEGASGLPGGEAAGLVVLEAPGAVRATWLPNIAESGLRGPALYHADDLDRKLSDAELWELLLRPADLEPSPAGGLAQMVSLGPVDLDRGEELRFTVAFLLGRDEAALRDGADLARQVHGSIRYGFGGRPATELALLPASPNPFVLGGGGTLLRFSLPQAGPVRLRVFDVRGRLVEELLSERLAAGFAAVSWGGTDQRGAPLARGVYHVLLETPSGRVSRPVTLLR